MRNKLDQFFRRKLQNRPVDFKESYWDEMEQLLPQKKKKRRGAIWLWAGLLFMGATVTYWTMETSASGTKKQPSTISLLKTTISTKTKTVLIPTQIPNNQHITREKTPKSTKKTLKISPKTAPISPKPILLVTEPSAQKRKKQMDVTSKKHRELTKPFAEATPTTIHSQKTNKEKIKANTQTLKPANTNAISHAFSAADKLPTIKPTPLGNDVNLNQSKVISRIVRRWQLGLLIERSLNSDQPSWQSGCKISYQITPSLSLGAEIKYLYQTGKFTPTTYRLDTTFSFGHNRLSTELLPTSQHFVATPIYLSFDKRRHSILAGIQFQKLLGVKGKVHTNQSTQLSPAVTNLLNTSKGWLPTKEFSSINTSLLLGYEYRLGAISIGLRQYYPIKLFSSKLTAKEGAKLSPTWNINVNYTLSTGSKALKNKQ